MPAGPIALDSLRRDPAPDARRLTYTEWHADLCSGRPLTLAEVRALAAMHAADDAERGRALLEANGRHLKLVIRGQKRFADEMDTLRKHVGGLVGLLTRLESLFRSMFGGAT